MSKSKNIQKIVDSYSGRKYGHTYEAVAAYCDFVENYLRAGGQFNDRSDLHFDIYYLNIISQDLSLDDIIAKNESWNITLGSHEDVKSCKKNCYFNRVYDLDNPLARLAPLVNLEILEEMTQRGLDVRPHKIMPIDNLEVFVEFLDGLRSLHRIYSHSDKEIFINTVIGDLFADMPLDQIRAAYARNSKSFLASYDVFNLMALNAFRRKLIPAQDAERRIANWKPFKL